MNRTTRNLLLLILAAVVLVAIGQFFYRSGVAVEEPAVDRSVFNEGAAQ
jgi:hypothetical protein